MKKIKRVNLKIGYLLALLPVFLIACSNEIPEIENITREQLMIEKGKDVEIIYSDSAQVRVRVTGPTMLYYTEPNNPRQEFTEGVKAYFYDALKNEQSVLVGKYAIRDERNKKVIIRDDVVWESITDGKLETSELIWDETTNVIRSTKFTKITRNKEVIYGYKFETNDKLTQWRLVSPKGTVKVDELEQQLK